MEHVKCECGHVNPHGTIFCESCGKPTEEDKASKKLLDMRYEGSARRSKVHKRTLIDKIWNFYSSVTVGVWLIVITIIASALGTVYPQQMYIPSEAKADPATYYFDQYGITGKLYYELGFHDLYGQWWYMVLIAFIGISLVVCSIDRAVPLYRALKKQGVVRHSSFLRRQRLYSVTNADYTDEAMNQLKEKLSQKRYHVRQENQNLLAEKGRFSRWGPYVNHIGLIIFLLGAMLRFIPGMYFEQGMWLRDGETKEVPHTNGQYYLKSEGFSLDVYLKENEKKVFEKAIENVGNGTTIKNYQTNVVLYKRVGEIIPGKEPTLEKVKEYEIRINEPLKMDGFGIYQVDYKLNEFQKMNFNVVAKDNEEKVLGTITIDLHNPEKEYDIGNGYSVEILKYYQDFFVNDEGEPASKSKVPNNPAFIFQLNTPGNPDGERSLVAIQEIIEPDGENNYKIKLANIDTINVSALIVHRDLTLWILAFGGLVFMIGLIQGMYWNHRRIWVQHVNGEWIIAAHTNKNWYGLKNDLKYLIKDTSFIIPVDQLDSKE